tara:strand:+ start:296 stop:604 length:309 start_codon:yes stop_codon:yes gene_type:complete
MGALGLFGITVPEQYGGAELDVYAYALFMDEYHADIHLSPINVDLLNSLVLCCQFTERQNNARNIWLMFSPQKNNRLLHNRSRSKIRCCQHSRPTDASEDLP